MSKQKQIIITLCEDGNIEREIKGINTYHEVLGLLFQTLTFFQLKYSMKTEEEIRQQEES